MLHHKYEVTIRFTTDRPLTEHERNCLMSYTVAQVDDPAIHDDDGNIQDADFRTWVKDVDLTWTGFVRRGPLVEDTHDCADSAWRWLDCADCKAAGQTCNTKVCVVCGAEVGPKATQDDCAGVWEPTPTCDVCAQPCDEEQREWCGACGNCADHCASEMDCKRVTA